ncbi:MAG: hypothetical protein IMX00_00860 [Limnochordales bacterium]|nr:hypothetical protein [Limnochordales bacterium]
MTALDLTKIATQRDMVRFFDGYSIERMEELRERSKLKRPVVKTWLLEVLDGSRPVTSETIKLLLERRGLGVTRLEESLFRVTDPKEGDIGFLEPVGSRVVALYSPMEADSLEKWARALVLSTPELDHVWLSGLTFHVLWNVVQTTTHPARFTRIGCAFESVFDPGTFGQRTPDGLPAEDDLLEEPDEDEFESDHEGEDEEDLESIRERRSATFRLVDRVGVIKERLSKLQALYSPLYAISQLRFPSPVGRGGHDFYDDGHVTNKSSSFRDHRAHVIYVSQVYEKLLRKTEEQTWYEVRESINAPGQLQRIVGAPVVIRFREPLDRRVFSRWISTTFGSKPNRFRLWGHPIHLGPEKVQVYGLDRHLWQPLWLELTTTGCIAIVPSGTCGNTVHRLVRNVQRYLDPGATAYIGNEPYIDLVQRSVEEVPYEAGLG